MFQEAPVSTAQPSEYRPAVSLVSLGCSKNQVDSERMLAGFLRRGFRYDPGGLDADMVVVNTCGFIGPAKQESVDTILELAARREERPNLRIAVAGCLFERYGDELRESLPEVDYWLEGPVAAAMDAVAEAEMGPIQHPNQTLGPRSILLNEPGLAYLRISQGCDRKCSFCAIPGFKGRQVSVPVEALVEDGQRLVDEQGVKELVLNAQDLCRYGADIGYQPGLAGLLEALLEGTSARWIRFLYAYPFSLPDEVLTLMAGEERLVSYLDMPFQHADTGVLRRMRRGHGGERFLEYLASMREAVPDLVTRSTILVGHPGETEAAFEVACDFVERARFEWMGVFEYSDEDGTHAETLDGKVAPEVSRRRAAIVQKLYEDGRRPEAFRLGEVQPALVGAVDGEMLVCRVGGQAPEVDGATLVPRASAGGAGPGDMLDVVVEEQYGLDLYARPARVEVSV